jgi:hypothetical protein
MKPLLALALLTGGAFAVTPTYHRDIAAPMQFLQGSVK